MFEVELKARKTVSEKKLLELGAIFLRHEFQEDTYLNGVDRDFRKTDEALRVRRVGDEYFLTYKGPKLRSGVKAREEIEVPITKGLVDVLFKLGFRESTVVCKSRRFYRLDGLEVCLDDVERLGSFVEIESKSLEDEPRIRGLFRKLGILDTECTTATYLDLLESLQNHV